MQSGKIATMSEPAPGYSRARRIYVLFALVLVYTLNFVDRTIVGALVEPIKYDLQLSDAEVGLLGGLAFSLFYSLLGIPIARLAEQYNRVRIISIAAALWSIMTAMCGFATNFIQLLLFRMGVGVGEAGCTPPAHSLISDYFPPSQRATALGIYSLGIPIGMLFGAIIGGWIAQEFSWREAFMIVGFPGVAIAVLLQLTVREPVRSHDYNAAPGVHQDEYTNVPSLFDVGRTLLGNRRVVLVFVAYIFISISSFSISIFAVPLLLRGTDLTLFEAASAYGLIVGIGAFIGTGSGGFFADHLARTGKVDRLFLPALALIVAAMLYVGGLFAANLTLMAVLVFVATVLRELYTGPALGAVLNSVSARMRARASAMLLFVINLIGLGFGPLLIGLISDIYARRALVQLGSAQSSCAAESIATTTAVCREASYIGLQSALTYVAIFYAIGGLFMFLASRTSTAAKETLNS